jgi:putative membrane protein
MRTISRVLVQLLANAAALYASQYFIEGFSVAPTIEAYAKVAAVLTLVNIFIRPILKFIFSPVIFITLGLGVIIVNALLLYGVDYFLPELAIAGLYPLVYATLIISVINYIASKSSKKKAE